MIDNTGMFFVGLLLGYVAAQQYIQVASGRLGYSEPMRNPIDVGPVGNHQIGGMNSHHLFSNMIIDEAERKGNIRPLQSGDTFEDKEKGGNEGIESLPRNAISQHIPIPQNYEVETAKNSQLSQPSTKTHESQPNNPFQQHSFLENPRTIDPLNEPYSKQSQELFQSDSDMIDKTEKHLFASIVSALAQVIQFISINHQSKQIEVDNATFASVNDSLTNITVNFTSKQSGGLQQLPKEQTNVSILLQNYDTSHLEYEEAHRMKVMRRKQKKMYFITSMLSIGLIGICLIRRTKEKTMQNISGESIRLPSEEIQEI